MKRITLLLTLIFVFGMVTSVAAFELVEATNVTTQLSNIPGYEYGLESGIFYGGSDNLSMYGSIFMQNNQNLHTSYQVLIGRALSINSGFSSFENSFDQSSFIAGKYKYFYRNEIQNGRRFYIFAMGTSFQGLHYGGGVGLDYQKNLPGISYHSEIGYLHDGLFMTTSGIKIFF